MRGLVLALATTALVGMMAVWPGLAAADPTTGSIFRASPPVWFPHRDATPWLFLLDQDNNCLSTIDWTAGTSFAVLQGYNSYTFDKNPIPTSHDLMDPTTMFRLYVDGTLQRSSIKLWNQAIATEEGNFWFVVKMYETMFQGGMTGRHLFTAEWYYLGTLDNACSIVVTFA